MNEKIQQAIQSALNKQKDRNDEVDVSLDEINAFGDRKSLHDIVVNIAKYNQMLSQRITFINSALTAAVPFTKENLYLVCAYTGNGKSTVAANISFPLYKEGKKSLVISNEETEHDILFRIACLELGLNFNDYKKGRMPLEFQRQAIALFPQISKYIKVKDVNFKNGLTTKIEGIKNLLTRVKDQDYSCVMIDYYQLIRYSVTDPSRDRFNVLDDLRIWMGQYIKTANIPIVLFAQLHSIGKRPNKDLDSRIKECPGVSEPATVIVEIVPNFKDATSDFIIHKDRFGCAGNSVRCGYDKGRYVKYTEEFQKKVEERQRLENYQKLDDLQHAIDGTGGGK
jgi:uncharacterized protein YaaR (DUF327 family)